MSKNRNHKGQLPKQRLSKRPAVLLLRWRREPPPQTLALSQLLKPGKSFLINDDERNPHIIRFNISVVKTVISKVSDPFSNLCSSHISCPSPQAIGYSGVRHLDLSCLKLFHFV